MKSKMIAWVTGVITVIVILIIVIVTMEPKGEGIPRAQAYKAMALALTSKEDCLRLEKERQASHFSGREKNNWFVKYMDYLYDEGYLDESLTTPSLTSAQEDLTYGEAAFLAARISAKLKSEVGSTKYNREDPFPEQEWWRLYSLILEKTDEEGAVKEVDAVLYGTPSNLPQAESWTAYTTQGNYGFQGLALDAYLDCEIRFLERDGEMIAMRELVSRDVVYENVWLSQADGKTIQVYLGTACREFPAAEHMGEEADLSQNLADLTMENGRLKKVTIKRERISGKVLAVTDHAIEIDGYGEIPISKNFHVYKIYGDFRILEAKDILVGYDLQEFVAAEGELCAALLEREFDAKTIRVLLMDTGFTSIFHSCADITLLADACLEYENGKGSTEEEFLAAGTVLHITPEDKRLSNGRLVITPEGADGIAIDSIERSQGRPVYGGSLEIKACAEGLVLVNDLYLEDYLTKVVPSEMPASYEMEALKAQAVCARTYGYRQIQGNSYSQYGAHVDDSTNFQVYNNTNTDEKTARAVKETYGKMLFYGDSPIEAFYYSTSCGYSSDGSVWGSEGAKLPYLKAKEIKAGGRDLGYEASESFDSYIRGSDAAAYDSGFAMFRWETDIRADELSGRISGAGSITDMRVVSRGAGGIADDIEITGTEGTVHIKGQSAIRSSLGSRDLKIRKKDGSVMEGSATLPSAFLSVEKRETKDGAICFHLYGGGFGHGVGMSQNGAQGMAKDGKDYQSILKFFYEGTELREVSETE